MLAGNKRAVASVKKPRTRKKRRESFCSDDDVAKAEVTSVAGRRSIRKRVTRKKPVLNFSSEEDSDFKDDAKENIQESTGAEEFEESVNDVTDEYPTPIRRKKTPKRSITRSVLRA